MNLKMEVYSPELELLGILETYTSLLVSDWAFQAGDFTLAAPLTTEAKALLVPENIIWFYDKTAGIIENYTTSAGEEGITITVKGALLAGILERRILWGIYELSGDAVSIMREIVEDCAISPTRGNKNARIVPGLVLDTQYTSGGPKIRKQQTGGTLLAFLEEVGAANQVAFGVDFDAAVPQMVFWARPGVDRTVRQDAVEPVFYGTELDDVLTSEYSYDAREQKNVSLIAGSGEGEDRIYITLEGGQVTETTDPTDGNPSQNSQATKGDIDAAIGESWEGSY